MGPQPNVLTLIAETLALAGKNFAKADIKVFWSYPVLVDFHFPKYILQSIVGDITEMIFRKHREKSSIKR